MRTRALPLSDGNSVGRVGNARLTTLPEDYHMLSTAQIVSYVPVSDLSRARKFYEEKLGFRPLELNDALSLIHI